MPWLPVHGRRCRFGRRAPCRPRERLKGLAQEFDKPSYPQPEARLVGPSLQGLTFGVDNGETWSTLPISGQCGTSVACGPLSP